MEWKSYEIEVKTMEDAEKLKKIVEEFGEVKSIYLSYRESYELEAKYGKLWREKIKKILEKGNWVQRLYMYNPHGEIGALIYHPFRVSVEFPIDHMDFSEGTAERVYSKFKVEIVEVPLEGEEKIYWIVLEAQP